MIFPSTIEGIPCQVEVSHFTPNKSARWDHPPEPGRVEFKILDRRGYLAPWLERKLNNQSIERIREEISVMVAAEYYEY